jgi:hypothetical protein
VASHGGGQGSRAVLLWKVNILQMDDIILGKPKYLQFKEDKELTEYMVSMIDQIMYLIGKDRGGAMRYPIRPSQSKGTSSGLGGR